MLKNTRNGSISCEANSALVDRPLPDCRPALFGPTVLLAAACRIRSQQPISHLAEKIPSEECPFVVSIAPQTSTAFHYAFFKPQPLMCFTSIWTGPAPTSTDFEPLTQRLQKAFLPIWMPQPHHISTPRIPLEWSYRLSARLLTKCGAQSRCGRGQGRLQGAAS